MPSLTRYFVKTSLVYLALGLLVGLALALQDVFSLPVSLSGLFPVYLHLLVIGWLSQLIFGIAFWMFPKYSREMPRGNESLGWGYLRSVKCRLDFSRNRRTLAISKS